MLDHLAAREAFRARLLTLVVATTGSTSLAATTNGYTRNAGSFLSDKFAAGMEVTPSGFSAANNVVAMIETVVAQTVTLKGITGRTPQTIDAGRSLTVGLPAIRQWHGTQTPEAILKGTRPSVVEQWVPSSVEDNGAIIDTGFYVVTLNLPGNYGLAAPLRYMQAMRDLFYPGLTFSVDGDLVRVTGSPAPSFSQPITLENGYESSSLTVPWRVATTNLLDQPE
jgi:hypothetical protein